MDMVSSMLVLGQNDAGAAAGGMMALMMSCCCPFIIIFGIQALCLWGIFTKAGKPGWASMVPIYNAILLVEIVGRPPIWVLFLFIPIANIYFGIMLVLDLAKCFGKDTGYAIGMILLPYVFYPMIGFGSAQYLGPRTGEGYANPG